MKQRGLRQPATLVPAFIADFRNRITDNKSLSLSHPASGSPSERILRTCSCHPWQAANTLFRAISCLSLSKLYNYAVVCVAYTRFLFLMVWRLGVWDQSACIVRSWWGLSSWLANSCLPMVFWSGKKQELHSLSFIVRTLIPAQWLLIHLILLTSQRFHLQIPLVLKARALTCDTQSSVSKMSSV